MISSLFKCQVWMLFKSFFFFFFWPSCNKYLNMSCYHVPVRTSFYSGLSSLKLKGKIWRMCPDTFWSFSIMFCKGPFTLHRQTQTVTRLQHVTSQTFLFRFCMFSRQKQAPTGVTHWSDTTRPSVCCRCEMALKV